MWHMKEDPYQYFKCNKIVKMFKEVLGINKPKLVTASNISYFLKYQYFLKTCCFDF